ncbi:MULTISPECIES: hypothetical protein [Lactobacillaceae]|uniref:Uncharacterized protein n=1 Tax=Limosilactobacillus alvi TaxID=990412 RepID=A0ABS2EQN8_9LACO|nr:MULTISPECIES: hypothetical protein [Lactobacillaceae]MBM6754371.1 hypothetical protein [Limosilactobacillus alvi]QLL69282.1 hypothetical protein GTO83_01250 [Lactobacillus sp. 3B(2020)]
MKGSIKRFVVTVAVSTFAVTGMISTNSGVHADTEAAVVTNATPVKNTTTSSALTSQLATKQAAVRAAALKVQSDNDQVNQIKTQLANLDASSDTAKTLQVTLATAKETLAADQATLNQLESELATLENSQTAATTNQATTNSTAKSTTTTSTPPKTIITHPATVQVEQSQAEAIANGYRIVDNRVVDNTGKIVNGWKVKNNVAYDSNGNAIKMTVAKTPVVNTQKVKLHSVSADKPTTKNGWESDNNHHQDKWQKLMAKVLSWVK